MRSTLPFSVASPLVCFENVDALRLRTRHAVSLRRRAERLLAAVVVSAGQVAFAADSEAFRRGEAASRGSPICSCLCTAIFIAIFRTSGVGWGLSIGTALLPGVFGWFVWRDRGLGTGIRVFALVLALLQVGALVLGIAAAVFIPNYLKYQQRAAAAGTAQAGPGDRGPVAAELNDPDDTLGLHPLGAVTSTPPGAKVFVDGQLVGVTPLKRRFDAGKRAAVRLEADGHFPETHAVEPNTNEHVALDVTLRAAAVVEVSSEPPGATAYVDGGVAVRATPGTTGPLEAGPTEIVVAHPGYVAERRVVDLVSGPNPLWVELARGAKVTVSSSPPGARVRLDGALLGVTPLDVYLPKKGKHALELSLEPLTPVKRVLTGAKDGQKLRLTLVDQPLLAAERRVAKARAAYDKANQALERAQRGLEAKPSPGLERQLAAAEQDMQRAAAAFEKAEDELRALRATRPPPPPEDEKR